MFLLTQRLRKKLRRKEHAMLVSYSSPYEVLVCEKEKEKEMLVEWFENAVRDVEDYDREEHDSVLQIRANLRISS